MLRISKLADYATVLMTYMAHDSEATFKARDIAAQTEIALPTVSKLLKLLTQANLLSSHRGVSGGYSLAQPITEISIAAVIKAIDGNIALTECSHRQSQCNLEAICLVKGNWQLISSAILGALDGISLADMIRPMTPNKVDIEKIRQQLRQRSSDDCMSKTEPKVGS